MPYKTRYGSHYHEKEGCCGATEPCSSTEGLAPCSICCGGGGGGSRAIETDRDVIGISRVTLGGKPGTLYKLDGMMDPDDRRAISDLDGVSTVIVASQYAPEIRRTGIFVEDGHRYNITKASDLSRSGAAGVTRGMSAPTPDVRAQAVREMRHEDEPSTGGSTPTPEMQELEREERISDIKSATYLAMLRDRDVSYLAGRMEHGMDVLLSACDVTPMDEDDDDDYTRALVEQYFSFVAAEEAGIGGSEADYCASNACTGTRGYRIRLRDCPETDEILAKMRDGISKRALYKDREMGALSAAGVPIYRGTDGK